MFDLTEAPPCASVWQIGFSLEARDDAVVTNTNTNKRDSGIVSRQVSFRATGRLQSLT